MLKRVDKSFKNTYQDFEYYQEIKKKAKQMNERSIWLRLIKVFLRRVQMATEFIKSPKKMFEPYFEDIQYRLQDKLKSNLQHDLDKLKHFRDT